MKYIIIISLILLSFSCQKDDDVRISKVDVCDNAWGCGWTYDQFVSRYGQPDTLWSNPSPYGTLSYAYWHCDRLAEGDETGEYIPYIWLYTDFIDGRLMSFVFIDEHY